MFIEMTRIQLISNKIEMVLEDCNTRKQIKNVNIQSLL